MDVVCGLGEEKKKQRCVRKRNNVGGGKDGRVQEEEWDGRTVGQRWVLAVC